MIDRLRQSLSFRLALAYAVLLSVSMGVLAGAYYWIAIAQPLDQIRARVDREHQVAAQWVRRHRQTTMFTRRPGTMMIFFTV